MQNNISLFSDTSLPASIVTSRQDHLTFKANTKQGRHGWLRLTPAYSVHLVEELVAQCDENDLVLDPFCGTGTTALVCAQNSVSCHTVDINPFLVWLANAKCAVYTKDAIEAARATLYSALATMDAARDAWTPPIKDISKWWQPETLRLLAQVFEQFQNNTLSEQTQTLLSIIFCRASIELSSSVSFGHQSMSFKKEIPSPTLFEMPVEMQVRNIFQRVGNTIFLSAFEPLYRNHGMAFHGDSRQLSTVLPSKSYTTVITSPPYPNRISYIRELRPYMYWLGYLESGRQAGELDWQAIGGTWGCATSKLMSWTPNPAIQVPYEGFDEVITQISQESQVLSIYVAKYFEDTVQHIRSLKGVLKPGAQVHYVVGNSKFYNVMLHTEQIYAAIFQAEGFQNVKVNAIRKRTSKKELFEYVVSAEI